MVYKIKEKAEEFQVKEIIDLKLSKTGDYTYFLLKKKNWTTIRALKQISRYLRVSRTRLGFAGNKDKHAVTEQAVSIWKVEPEQLEQISPKDIEITVLGKGKERINLGDLKGNFFRIVVHASQKELKKAEKNIPKIQKDGFLNLFGSQRFGASGNTHKIGENILNGDLEGAVKALLTGTSDNKEANKFSAFTKKNWGKWKEILAKCPKFLGIEKAVLNWLVKQPTDFGGALREIAKPTRRIFVHAYQSWIWNKEAPTTKKKVLNLPPLKCKRMPELECLGTERKVRAKPKKLKAVFEKHKLTLEFELEKGTYATTLLQALFE